jgi:hypothetical protein
MPRTFRAFLYKKNTNILGLKRGNIPERAPGIHPTGHQIDSGVHDMNGRNFLTIALLALSALITGCKGQLEGTTIENARFVSTNAQGVVTHTGLTDAAGSFSYNNGDTVSFFIGDVLLGKVPAADKVPTATLVATARNADALNNLNRFLQAMDSDVNAQNGIQINASAHQAATGLAVNFDAAMKSFQVQAGLVKLLALSAGTPTLPEAVDAITQFRLSLLNAYNRGGKTTVLDLVNTRWTSTFSSSDCANTVQNSHQFNLLGHISSGMHNLVKKADGSCAGANFAIAMALYENDFLFSCANNCSFADLNRDVTLNFPVAHTATLVHQPGSNVITIIHRYDGRDVIETMVKK